MRISDWSSDVCSSDLLWELRKDVQAFIDVTRSQDVPDFSDLVQSGFSSTNFVPLDAQKAWTLETVTRGKYERFGWDVTAYHRSEARRVGKVCASTCSSRWTSYHDKQKKKNKTD